MWKSAIDIEEIHKNLERLDLLESLYSLSVVWVNAIYPEDYKSDSKWPSLLKLSGEGENMIRSLSIEHGSHEEPDFYLALFGIFFHHDLLFDHEKSDIKGITELLEHEILSEKIRFPMRFGRCLYDRFNDTHHSNRTNHLLPRDTQKLIEGTPKGIYQVGSLVLGPLGVLAANEPRAIYPSLNLPLWHCSDTGCNAIHQVRLVPPTTSLQKIYRDIDQQCRDEFGPPSEWNSVLRWFHRRGRWKKRRKYSTIVELIADCILGRERTELVSHALMGSEKRMLRAIIERPPRKKNFSEGSAFNLAQKLDAEEQLQLLMVLEDHLLIEYIDELIVGKKIRIPPGERRTPEFRARGRSSDEPAELSSLGIRSSSNSAIIDFSTLIWNAYASQDLTNELDWKLRQVGEKSTWESLFEYIRTTGPGNAVKELVLSSSTVTKIICEEVQLSLSHVVSNDDDAAQKLLWKLGFNPEEFDDQLKRLKSRLVDFNETLLSVSSIDTEDNREIIRSIGVNLFVSLEEYIDKLVSFNVWYLSEDHFVSNRFNYDIGAARSSVGSILGPTIHSDGQSFSWSSKGDNSLGILLRYLAEAALWMSSLETNDRESLKRCEDDLPHFNDDVLRPFPFKHTKFWADSEIGELIKYKNGFLSIAKLIQQADLAFIRNGIDHHRNESDFPSIDKMLACVVRLQQAVENSDINRYFPKHYWLTARKGDRFGVVEYIFKDYSKKILNLYGPAVAAGMPKPIYKYPVVIGPGNLLGYPNSQVIFRSRDPSEYYKYWDGYPRRRKINLTVDIESLVDRKLER